MKKRTWLSAVVVFCLGTFLLAPPAFSQDKAIKLNWVSFLPKTQPETAGFQKIFVDRVNERAKGELVIHFRGGPETFSALDIPKATQKGLVDIGMVFVGAVEPVVPGVGADMLTRLTLEEERAPGGAYDFVLDQYKKAGLYYLGRGYHKDGFFYTWLRKKKVQKKEDLAGMIIGGTTAAQPAALAWGCTYTPIQLTDSYSAMERGVVDAISAQPPTSWKDFGNYEVSKYVIDHPIYASTPRIFVNLNTFNKLPKHLQELLVNTFIEAEKEMAGVSTQINQEAMKWMVEKKHIEPIKLSPEDAKWYVESAYKGAWDFQQKRFPEITPKLRQFYTK
jgi:TRAP-type C4-dicarboxylate transport system substrate-binding protein